MTADSEVRGQGAVVIGDLSRKETEEIIRRNKARAVELLSTLVPGTLTQEDPVAFRHILFRIAVGDARGGEARRRAT
jgi:hypothetical protein